MGLKGGVASITLFSLLISLTSLFIIVQFVYVDIRQMFAFKKNQWFWKIEGFWKRERESDGWIDRDEREREKRETDYLNSIYIMLKREKKRDQRPIIKTAFISFDQINNFWVLAEARL